MTLFLLPGLLCDRYIFEPQIDGLSDLCEVRVPNFFGFDSLTKMAESVLDIAPRSFALAGFSMGGRVALEVMRLAAGGVEGLCLFDTGVHGTRPGEAENRQALIDLAYTQGMRALADRWLPPMLHPAHRSIVEIVEPLTEMVMRATPEIHERQIRALLNRRDATGQLSEIRLPTLIVCGAEDEWSGPDQHRMIAQALPNAKLTIIEDAGHFVSVEQPSAFTAVLREWLIADCRRAAGDAL